jgi:hypothetical protein
MTSTFYTRRQFVITDKPAKDAPQVSLSLKNASCVTLRRMSFCDLRIDSPCRTCMGRVCRAEFG